MIRPVQPNDTPALMALIDGTGLFPSHMLGDMLSEHFADGPGRQDHFWVTDDEAGPVGLAYYAPERMTEGTWNLYLIAVHPDRQREGRGGRLLRFVEESLTARGERILLIETSGLASFEGVRTFYRNCGYEEEATIRDFYNAGEDKIVWRKVLASASGRSTS